jgi:hypothetical protein
MFSGRERLDLKGLLVPSDFAVDIPSGLAQQTFRIVSHSSEKRSLTLEEDLVGLGGEYDGLG